MPSSLQCAKKGLHRFQRRCSTAGFCASRQSAMHWNRVAPVETGATSLVSLLSCLMATLRVGCTGFSAGATSLVSLLSCLMATLRVGCTGFNRCCVAGFCASRQSAMHWNRVAPVETGATSLVLSMLVSGGDRWGRGGNPPLPLISVSTSAREYGLDTHFDIGYHFEAAHAGSFLAS